jgi:hypothetical protein
MVQSIDQCVLNKTLRAECNVQSEDAFINAFSGQAVRYLAYRSRVEVSKRRLGNLAGQRWLTTGCRGSCLYGDAVKASVHQPRSGCSCLCCADQFMDALRCHSVTAAKSVGNQAWQNKHNGYLRKAYGRISFVLCGYLMLRFSR